MKKLVLLFICLGFILVSCQQPNVDKEELDVPVKTATPESTSDEKDEVPTVKTDKKYPLPEVSCFGEITSGIIYYVGTPGSPSVEKMDVRFTLCIETHGDPLDDYTWKVPTAFMTEEEYVNSGNYNGYDIDVQILKGKTYIYYISSFRTYAFTLEQVEEVAKTYKEEVAKTLKPLFSVKTESKPTDPESLLLL